MRFGSLRQVTPFSREFGYDRGQPIDRYYIEQFLSAHASDVRGHVLEIADDTYTRFTVIALDRSTGAVRGTFTPAVQVSALSSPVGSLFLQYEVGSRFPQQQGLIGLPTF